MNIEEICNRMWEYAFLDEHIKKVRVALEKQVPKKPTIDGYTANEYCPNCKQILRTFVDSCDVDDRWEREDLYPNYCEDCGQALDWSEAESHYWNEEEE